jgi:hypothetical protein
VSIGCLSSPSASVSTMNSDSRPGSPVRAITSIACASSIPEM